MPEHKPPVMSTRNRLHEFLVDDACALACSGMLRKNENRKPGAGGRLLPEAVLCSSERTIPGSHIEFFKAALEKTIPGLLPDYASDSAV